MTEADVEQEWIESPDGWGTKEDTDDGGGGVLDLFGDNNPNECFTYNINLDDATTKTIRLHGYKLDSDETDRSTGVTLWQAAPRLADYIQQNYTDICTGKYVLEVGAGLGLCGTAAHHLGAKHVIMTDGDIYALQKLRENVRQNCIESSSNNIDCKQLLWGTPNMEKFLQQYGQFDTILGADVIYTKESVEPLLDTVACLLKKPNGKFVLSRYNKWNNVDDAIVIEAAKERCLDCSKPSEGIYIFRWTEKC